MTKRKADPSPIEICLAPLARLARIQPEIEALVFWGDAAGWDDAPSEALESEEIAFYCEGLLEDGFHLIWTVVALTESPTLADHVRLQFWQDDCPHPPALPPGWVALDSARWTAA
jgi:hypothetical protein